jgi:hypothetical protein
MVRRLIQFLLLAYLSSIRFVKTIRIRLWWNIFIVRHLSRKSSVAASPCLTAKSLRQKRVNVSFTFVAITINVLLLSFK